MLNKTKISKLKPRDKLYRVSAGDQLYLEITPAGKRYWRVRYRNCTGNWSMKSLGEFPGIELAQARKLRDEFLGQLEFTVITFEQAAKDWYATQVYKSEKNKKQVWSMIDTYLIPDLGKMPMSAIKAKDILPILKKIESRGKLEQCKRVRTKASQIFRYGIANLMCEYDPAHLLQGATAKPRPVSMAAITDEPGFQALLQTIEQADNLHITVKIGLQLSPYIFLRSNEIRKMTWGMVNCKERLIAISGDIMKRGRDHLVPLHDRVIELLELAREHKQPGSDLVLPGLRKGRPLSENTFNQALRSLGYSGDRHVHHGFRASFSTLGREVLRFENDLIERQLAHVQKDTVRAAYDRSYRIEERAVMMQEWGDYLGQLSK